MGEPWCLEFAFADGSHRLRDNKIRRRVKFILIAQHSNERLYHGAYMLNFCSRKCFEVLEIKEKKSI